MNNKLQRNTVNISTEDARKLFELAKKVGSVKLVRKLLAVKIEMREDKFERKIFAGSFIGNIRTRNETDEDDNSKPIEFEGKPFFEMIIRERR